MSNLTSSVWWKAAGTRAWRTALVLLIPYAPTVLYDGNYLIVLSAAGLGAVTSLITSLFGIAETQGTSVSWYWAVFERAVKTAAQALLTVFGTATLFSQVHWSEAPALVGSAVLGSVLLAMLKSLPEADPPVAQLTVPTTVVNNYGQAVQAEVPVVTAVAPEDVPAAPPVEDTAEEQVPDTPAPLEATPTEEPPAPEAPPTPDQPARTDTRVPLR